MNSFLNDESLVGQKENRDGSDKSGWGFAHLKSRPFTRKGRHQAENGVCGVPTNLDLLWLTSKMTAFVCYNWVLYIILMVYQLIDVKSCYFQWLCPNLRRSPGLSGVSNNRIFGSNQAAVHSNLLMMYVCVLPDSVCVMTCQWQGILVRGKCHLGAISPRLGQLLT